jgi:antitoxin component of MazEF toxin-antitoxin module
MDEYTLTKKISKMGDNHILIIPKDLREQIGAGDLVEVKLKIISKSATKKTSKVQKKTKPADPKLVQIIKHFKEQGYAIEKIKAVLKKNGYKHADVMLAIKHAK